MDKRNIKVIRPSISEHTIHKRVFLQKMKKFLTHAPLHFRVKFRHLSSISSREEDIHKSRPDTYFVLISLILALDLFVLLPQNVRLT